MHVLGAAASGLQALQLQMDTLGNNIANIDTMGYKQNKVEFAEALAIELRGRDVKYNNVPVGDKINIGSGVVYSATSTDFRQGGLRETQNPTDLAIAGEGLFAVHLPNGDSAYTRDGSFRIDAQRNLVDKNGNHLEVRIPPEVTNLRIINNNQIVGNDVDGNQKLFGQVLSDPPLGNIQTDARGRVTDENGDLLPVAFVIPLDATDIEVTQDGTIHGRLNEELTEFGMITLAKFDNNSGLLKNGENLFTIPPDQSNVGQEVNAFAGSTKPNPIVGLIKSGALEGSNVDLTSAMTDMLQVQRAYQMNSKMIQHGDQMLGLANSIRR